MPSIRSTRVIVPEGERPATVRWEEGVVVAVGDGPADVDFGDLAILPGLVDAHVHVNEPGRTEWEGFATATRAAAAGGTTTIVDMPLNSIPPTVDLPALEAKRAAASAQTSVDVAFWAGVIPGSDPWMGRLVEEGVCGFKVFLVDSGVTEYPPVATRDLGAVLADLGDLPLLVHAEDPGELLAPSGDPRLYSTYLASRPGIAEAAAIEEMARLARAAGSHVHILHAAGQEAVAAIRRARPTARLTAETCPHYLTFVAAEIPDGATAYKCAPPIRQEDDREALWEALADGTIDMVVSDHSPAPPEMKDLDGGDFIVAWGGIASLELRLVATWHGARRRRHGLGRLVEWLASSPARLAGLQDRKGSIVLGGDADFVIFDPDDATAVRNGELAQRHPITPYHGMTLAGRVILTYLGGRRVHGDGADESPQGRLLKRGTGR
ncbi:allantoinase AllB [soil metagenome]